MAGGRRLWYNYWRSKETMKQAKTLGARRTPPACAQKALKISAKARYALRALLDVASHARGDEPRTGAAIAASQGLSEKFLSRIVIPLRQRGILRSVRGNVGGFRLAKSPEDITLLEIVETMQGPLAILDCLAPGAKCPREENCLARGVWADVNTSFRNTLAKVTLAAILRREANGERPHDYCI